jgi:hypothetical protein
VTLSIDGAPVGNTTAAPDGSFDTLLTLREPLGHFTVVAMCGPTLTAPIDIVLTSQAGPPTTTITILLILFLLFLYLVPRQLRR